MSKNIQNNRIVHLNNEPPSGREIITDNNSESVDDVEYV